jgi:hypothetical protein
MGGCDPPVQFFFINDLYVGMEHPEIWYPLYLSIGADHVLRRHRDINMHPD